MKLDAHPLSMALIMLALGVCGIGVILTITFFSDTTMLGIGVALAILGAAAGILGCIHRLSRDDVEFTKRRKKGDKYKTNSAIAPERIPSPSGIEHDASFDRADHGLFYEPCSVSPERMDDAAPNHFILNTADGAPVFPGGSPNDYMRVVPKITNDYLAGNATTFATPQQSRRANVQAQINNHDSVLSPFHQRSFPVPQQYDASRGELIASPVVRRSVAGGHEQSEAGYPHRNTKVAQPK